VIVELRDNLEGVSIPRGHLNLVLSVGHVVGDRHIERDGDGARVGPDVADRRLAVADGDRHVVVVDVDREPARGRHPRIEVVSDVHLPGVEDVESHRRLGAARDGSLRQEEVEHRRPADLSVGRLRGDAVVRVHTGERGVSPVPGVGGRRTGGAGQRGAGEEGARRQQREGERNESGVRLIRSLRNRSRTDRGPGPRVGRRTRRIESYGRVGRPRHKRVE